MSLGERIKQHRGKSGLSQEKIAELVGVSRQAVTKWESGQSVPSMANLITLTEIFEVSLGELTGSINDNIPLSNSSEQVPKGKKGTVKLIFAIFLGVIGIMSVTLFSTMNSFTISRITGVSILSANVVRLGVQIGGGMMVIAAVILFVLYVKSGKRM